LGDRDIASVRIGNRRGSIRSKLDFEMDGSVLPGRMPGMLENPGINPKK